MPQHSTGLFAFFDLDARSGLGPLRLRGAIGYLARIEEKDLEAFGGKSALLGRVRRAGEATAEFYLAPSCADGIPMWDTGAPGLVHLGDLYSRPSEPRNPFEPVDSSAAAIAVQGLIRLGLYFSGKDPGLSRGYVQAGLTVAQTLFSPPYLSEDPAHQGLILHSIYHHPNGWDYRPEPGRSPYGESSMWGDYHAMELALIVRALKVTSCQHPRRRWRSPNLHAQRQGYRRHPGDVEPDKGV